MTPRRRRILIAAAIAGAAIFGLAIALDAVVPAWLRGAIERWGTEALGTKLAIAGPFDLTLFPGPALSAGGVALASADWASEPAIVRADRVTVRLDARSLLTLRLRLRDVEIDGAHVALERDGTGRGSWVFPAAARPRPPSPRPPLRVVVEHASVRGFTLTYRSRPDASPLRVGVRALEARLDPGSGMVDLEAEGHLDDAPWEIAGTLGTLERLYAVRDVDHALTGRIGGSTVTVRGRIRDPLTLAGPDVEIDVRGPDVADAAAAVGLRAPSTGPYLARARLTSVPEGVEAVVALEVGGVSAGVRGRASALTDPARFDATVEARGPDASVVGRWIRLRGLPPRPFRLAGTIRRARAGLALEGVKVRVGGTSLTVDGTIGPPPRCVGTALEVAGEGTDASELSALTRLRLPPGRFSARGRFLRRPDALAIERVEVRRRDAVIRAEGAIGEPPRLENLDLSFEASGADAAPFSGIARVDLPSAPFALRGRVARRGGTLALDGVEARLGDDVASADGDVVLRRGAIGTELAARIAGPDLSALARRFTPARWPAEPFALAGRVRVAADGYALEGVEARAGRLRARAEGHLGKLPALDGTALACRLEGAALSDLSAWGAPARLPADPFRAAGRIRVADGILHVGGLTAVVGEDRLEVDGALGALPETTGFDLAVRASGPSLRRALRFAPGQPSGTLARLPEQAYAISGRVRGVPGGVELRDVGASIGDASLAVAGTLARGAGMAGTSLRFEAHAPDASIPAALAGRGLPDGPFAASGGIEIADAGYRLDGVTVSVGGARVEASGALGSPPRLDGTDLDIAASGPDLAEALGPLTGVSPLPAATFDVRGHVSGGRTEFVGDPFVARVGGDEIEGRFAARLAGTPSVDGRLRARRLDVTAWLGGTPAGSVAAPPAKAPKPKKKRQVDAGFVLPDRPLELDALRGLDVRLELTADELLLPGLSLRDVVVEGGSHEGALRLSRLEGVGPAGGRASGSLSLEPSNGAFRLRANGRLEQGKFDVAKKTGGVPEQMPAIDVDFEVEGTGGSLHAIAASGDGRLLAVLGPGRIPSGFGDLATSGLVRGLLDALNPFRKSSPYTGVECGVVAATLENGKAAVEPIAARTDKMTLVGKGKIDFRTEALDLDWTIKPRRGVGITAGSIANPYIKLGGTLAAPSIEAKPIEAAASTGAAVATAGLTLLFRGFYDRITAERKVCVRALEKAEKAEAERRGGEGP